MNGRQSATSVAHSQDAFCIVAQSFRNTRTITSQTENIAPRQAGLRARYDCALATAIGAKSVRYKSQNGSELNCNFIFLENVLLRRS